MTLQKQYTSSDQQRRFSSIAHHVLYFLEGRQDEAGCQQGWRKTVQAGVPGDSPIRRPLPLQPPRPRNFLTATPRPTFYYKSPSAHIPDPASNPPGFLFPSDKDQVRVSLSDLTLPAFAALFHPESPFRLSTWTPKMYCVLQCFPEALKRKPLSSSPGTAPCPF